MKMKNYNSINNENDHHHSPKNINHTNILNPHPQDHLAPPFSSPKRQSTLLIGTFNLIATVIGGGVLSLPIVFAKCGIAFTTLSMALSAYMTYMSLLMLCYCSRRGGGSSYGEVVRSAFGETMEGGVSWLLFVYLFFAIIGYMVLVRDIWTPLVKQLLVHFINGSGSSSSLDAVENVSGDYVLLGIVILSLPFVFQHSLYALRWNCYVGFASVSILCIALCLGGWEHLHDNAMSDYDSKSDDTMDGSVIDMMDNTSSNSFTIQYFKIPTLREFLFSFPIVLFSFLCQFNMISVQNALSQPTRERMQQLIGYAIGSCFLLMYMFGLGGYLYAGDDTLGNILLNLPAMGTAISGSDESSMLAGVSGSSSGSIGWLFLLGRIGCGITIVFAIPIVALPCREALLEVVNVRFHQSHHRSSLHTPVEDIHGENVSEETMANNTVNNKDEECCWKLMRQCNTDETIQDAVITTEDELTELLPTEDNGQAQECCDADNSPHHGFSVLVRTDSIKKDYVFRNKFLHYGSTLLIISLGYCAAVLVREVALIWSFVGSSMAFFIAFLLPCGCFIVIESGVPRMEEGGDRRVGLIYVAWVILCFSVVGASFCTWNSFASL